MTSSCSNTYSKIIKTLKDRSAPYRRRSTAWRHWRHRLNNRCKGSRIVCEKVIRPSCSVCVSGSRYWKDWPVPLPLPPNYEARILPLQPAIQRRNLKPSEINLEHRRIPPTEHEPATH